MRHTVRIASTGTLLGKIQDTVTYTEKILPVYRERLAEDLENRGVFERWSNLQDLSTTLRSKAQEIQRTFSEELEAQEERVPNYQGDRTGRGITVTAVREENGSTDEPLQPRTDLLNHSPTGFDWGYPGSGPAQLALALLADLTGDGEYAVRNHQEFKSDVVAVILHDKWTILGQEIQGWVQDHP